MNLFVFVILLFFSYQTHAESVRAFLESPSFDEICDKTVYAKPPFEAIGVTWKNFYLLRRPSFTEGNGFIYVGIGSANDTYSIYRIDKLNPLSVEKFYQISGSANDVLWNNDSLFILQNRSLSKLNIANKTVESLVLSTDVFHKRDRAYDMAMLGNSLYVAHGTKGLIVIDTTNFKIVKTIDLGLIQSNGHESLASAIVSINDQRLIVGVDNLTMPQPTSTPFNGLIEITVKPIIIKKYPYRSGIFTANSKLAVNEKTLWINNSGVLQYVSLDSLVKNNSVYTNYISSSYFENKKKWSAEVLGDFFIMGDDIFACAIQSQIMTTKPVPKKGIAYRPKSVAKPKKIAFKKLGLEVITKWLDGPYATDFKNSTLKVELYNSKGELASLPPGIDLGFYAAMPSMGHAATDMGYFGGDSFGVYVNSQITLGMTGDWMMSLRLYDKNLVEIDEVVFETFL